MRVGDGDVEGNTRAGDGDVEVTRGQEMGMWRVT